MTPIWLLSERSSNGQARHAVNLGSTWRVAPRWSLEGYYQRSTGRSRQILILDPLAPPLTDTLRLADRSFYVVLRYEFSAGSRDVPLGGPRAMTVRRTLPQRQVHALSKAKMRAAFGGDFKNVV